MIFFRSGHQQNLLMTERHYKLIHYGPSGGSGIVFFGATVAGTERLSGAIGAAS